MDMTDKDAQFRALQAKRLEEVISDTRDLSEKIAYLADFDWNLPFSLMVDAWDMLDKSGQGAFTRAEFAEALNAAYLSYQTMQINRHNSDRSVDPEIYVQKTTLDLNPDNLG